MIRSLGPLITGLICAGKLGSNIAAELGSMKVTEQIDAMEVSGTRPFTFLVVSRVVASTIALPLLVVYADCMALLGSFMTVSINADNAVGVLLADTACAQRLKNTIGNTERASQKLDQNMEALKHNFLLRGYFRRQDKKEKEGGK